MNYQVSFPTPTFGAVDCYYLRLWVENLGNTRAEQVQVFAAKLLRQTADGSFKEVDGFLPMNLKWAHGRRSGGGPEVFAEGISPKMGKHCDLGHVLDPKFRKDLSEDLPGVSPDKTIIALELEFPPNTLSHLVPPGTYQLQVRVAAANSTPVVKTLEIVHTGSWFSDEAKMLTDGLGVKVLPPARR